MIGKNEKRIAEHVRNQLLEDYTEDQIPLKEHIDPFTDGRENKGK